MPNRKTVSIPHNVRVTLEDLSHEQIHDLFDKIFIKLRSIPNPKEYKKNDNGCVIADCTKKILVEGSELKSYENIRRIMYLLFYRLDDPLFERSLTLADHQEVVSYCGNKNCIAHLEPETRKKGEIYRPHGYARSTERKSMRYSTSKPFDIFDENNVCIVNNSGFDNKQFFDGVDPDLADGCKIAMREYLIYLLMGRRTPHLGEVLKLLLDSSYLEERNATAISKLLESRDYIDDVDHVMRYLIEREDDGNPDHAVKKFMIDQANYFTNRDYNEFKTYLIDELKLDSFSIGMGFNVPVIKKKSVHDLLEEQQALNELEPMPEHEENGAITT